MSFLNDLREADIKRSKEWGGNPSLEFRTIEFAGEAGELCDAIKKKLRHLEGMKGGVGVIIPIEEEIGDVLITLDRLAQCFNIDLEKVTIDKFNKTSEKHNFETKL